MRPFLSSLRRHLWLARRILCGMIGLAPLGYVHAEPFRFVAPEDHARLMGFFPPTDNEFLASLPKREVVFYPDNVMPPAYQLDGGVHSPAYNISATKPFEPHGNANREFPWAKTAGLDNCPTADALRFAIFPTSREPIRYWRAGNVTQWVYPDGMVFGEILIERGPEGYWYTFEVRTREKISGKWKPNVFRPYRSPVELADQVRALSGVDVNAQRLVTYLEGGRTVRSQGQRNPHPVAVFDRESFSDPLPAIPDDMVRRLLNKPFRSVAGRAWLESEGATACYAPTTDSEFHVVPKGYNASAMAVTSRNCMDCHRTTLMEASVLQSGRDWYGRVRGSDGIFSFHIFEPGSISYNGFTQAPRLRRELIQAGLLKP